MKKEKCYEVELTNTWRVEVYAKSEEDAKREIYKLPCDGYGQAIDFNGLEFNYFDEIDDGEEE